jgi:ABC-2 type transport system ATP-binding protein
MPILEVNHLIKRYNKSDKNAVDDISFSVNEGEFFAFLGPNGAGKTTTISILTTTLAKTGGTVKVAGFDLDSQAKEVRRNIGIIFQNPSLDLNLTAEENIRLHVCLYGLYTYRPLYRQMPSLYQKQITELAEVLELKDNMFKPLKTFSGGMKRKLEIIRSLMHKPRLLFLDEPTQGLDPVSRKSLWEYLQQVHRAQNTSIFLTTHNLEEAEDADRVGIINQGRLIFLDAPDGLKKRLEDDYVLLDAEDQESLLNEIGSYHPETTNEGHFKVRFNGRTPQGILNKIRTPLTLLRLHNPTLEEAYINMLDNQVKEEVLS